MDGRDSRYGFSRYEPIDSNSGVAKNGFQGLPFPVDLANATGSDFGQITYQTLLLTSGPRCAYKMYLRQSIMKIISVMFRSSFLLAVLVPAGSINLRAFQASPGIAERARDILEARCAACHRDGSPFPGAAAKLKVRRYDDVMSSGRVTPRNENSVLLAKVKRGDMPPGSPLPVSEINVLRDWVMEGARSWDSSSSLTRPFLTEDKLLQLIVSDLTTQSQENARYIRYYSVAHLYNSGASQEELDNYRVGLSKLINSLSHRPRITKPFPIDPARTLLRIDLRDFDWDAGTWKTILDGYPYGVRSPAVQEVKRLSGADLPYVRADWFVFHASIPPLYHQILRLPTSIRQLETELGVDIERDFVEAKNIARVGLPESGVSDHNRIVERHDMRSSNGAYWRSYDFKTSSGDDNILTNPLTFRAAGGEVIYNLPNGLQAYFLANAVGNRLDGPADIEIVRDLSGGVSASVVNGRSCIGCHFEGMKPATDHIRATVTNSAASRFDRSKVLAIYNPQSEIDALLQADKDRFVQAVRATGAKVGPDEPINVLSKRYHQPLTLDLAAAELGYQTDALRQKIRERRKLGELGFGQLLEPGGSIQRDAWEEHFAEVTRDLAVPAGLVTPKKPTEIGEASRVPRDTAGHPDLTGVWISEPPYIRNPPEGIDQNERSKQLDIRQDREQIIILSQFPFSRDRQVVDVGGKFGVLGSVKRDNSYGNFSQVFYKWEGDRLVNDLTWGRIDDYSETTRTYFSYRTPEVLVEEAHRVSKSGEEDSDPEVQYVYHRK